MKWATIFCAHVSFKILTTLPLLIWSGKKQKVEVMISYKQCYANRIPGN